MGSNKEYQRLKKIWYKKLKKSGFEDIENEDGYLLVWSTKLGRSDGSSPEERQEFYEMADRFLREHDFKNNRERVIWEYYTNGLGSYAISNIFKKARLKTCSPATIRKILKILKNLMLEKYLIK